MWSLYLFILHTVKAQETWEKPARFVHSCLSAILRGAFASKFGTSPYRLRCPFGRARWPAPYGGVGAAPYGGVEAAPLPCLVPCARRRLGEAKWLPLPPSPPPPAAPLVSSPPGGTHGSFLSTASIWLSTGLGRLPPWPRRSLGVYVVVF